jgi:hypothetical protein
VFGLGWLSGRSYLRRELAIMSLSSLIISGFHPAISGELIFISRRG